MSNAAPPPLGEVGLKERFYRYFQNEVTAVQTQIDALTSPDLPATERGAAIDQCLAAIERLSHEVKDAGAYIPAYEKRTYGETIKSLSDSLQKIRTTFSPPKKFSFKAGGRKKICAVTACGARTQQERLVPVGEDARQDAVLNSQGEDELGSGKGKGKGKEKEREEGNSIEISGKEGVYITLPASPSSSSSTSGVISNLTRCLVDLTRHIPSPSSSTTPSSSSSSSPQHPLATLTLLHTTRTLLLTGPISGPIHITSLQNSILITACRQFRMHSSSNVTVYLWSASRPIIEDCTGIRFVELPEGIRRRWLGGGGEDGKGGMDMEGMKGKNYFDQIDDFKWLQIEHSPNFRVLRDGEGKGEEVQKAIEDGVSDGDVEKVLRRVGLLEGDGEGDKEEI